MSDHEHHGNHVSPASTLLNVFFALMVLTVATIAVAQVHLPGAAAVIVALGIATLKATLVAGFFMHLKYDTNLNKVIFGVSVALVIFMIAFVLIDGHFYYDNIHDFQRDIPGTPVQ